MKNLTYPRYEVIVVGSGMGGMTAASLLARDGFRVLVLEESQFPGGLGFSSTNKGLATGSNIPYMIDYDEHQPLVRLENMLGIRFSKKPIDPPLVIRIGEKTVEYHKENNQWITEVARVFGKESGQRKFWERVFQMKAAVWRLSGKKDFIPPLKMSEWFSLVYKNSFRDLPALRYARQSVRQVMRLCGVDTEEFRSFIDEQLMLTVQKNSEQTSFMLGAAGLITCSGGHFYLPEGYNGVIKSLQDYIASRGGTVLCNNRVSRIDINTDLQTEANENQRWKENVPGFIVTTDAARYHAVRLITHIPACNLPEIANKKASAWFDQYSGSVASPLNTFVMNMTIKDNFTDKLPMFHYIHLDSRMPHTRAGSLLVSISELGNTGQAPPGYRALNVNCYTETDPWFQSGAAYDRIKTDTRAYVLNVLEKKLPGFRQEAIHSQYESTPVDCPNGAFRKKYRVDRKSQVKMKSQFGRLSAQTPIDNWYLTGEAVFPDKGLSGQTLSGITTYWRILSGQL
ncbi:MAG: FAD-dependent oxidoreductase [Balneolales bacterium]